MHRPVLLAQYWLTCGRLYLLLAFKGQNFLVCRSGVWAFDSLSVLKALSLQESGVPVS
uniref:Uncharacterized protein n=1 Tax=Anguilla anguilla TaxID=7936 RepID=A0A0E9PFX4_ANGAN